MLLDLTGCVAAGGDDRGSCARRASADRYVMITDLGEVYALPDFDVAMQALANPETVGRIRLAKDLTGG